MLDITIGFTGQYNDTLTGLDYYNARYYDPVVGVFLSADTVQGNLQGLNPYNYVGAILRRRMIPPGSIFPALMMAAIAVAAEDHHRHREGILLMGHSVHVIPVSMLAHLQQSLCCHQQ